MKIIELFEKINLGLEWPIRILFTITLFYIRQKAHPYEETYYWDISLGLFLIALWFYFFKMRIVSLFFLFFTLFIAYVHP